MVAQVAVEQVGDVVVIRPLQAKLTKRSGADELVEHMRSAVNESGYDRMVLDLSEVDFLCSAALNELVVLDKQVKRQGGRWSICSARNSIAEIFNITRLNSVFSVIATRDEAVERLSDSPPIQVGGVGPEIE